MPDCFNLNKFLIRDGPLTLYRIDSDGAITEEAEGTVSNGRFHD